MAALTEDRRSNMQDGEIVTLPVEAATKIYTGAITAVNAAGNGLPAADAAGLVSVGRAEETVDNSAGAAGALTVKVRKLKAFWYANSSGSPVTKAHLHGLATIYIEDDNTVSSATGTNSVIAGKGLAVDATLGVLIYFD